MLGYLAGSAAYVVVPVIIVLVAARPSLAAIGGIIWPRDADRRLAAAAFWTPLLFPALGALATGTEITSLWSMSAWTLLPVMLLSPPDVTLREIDTRRLVAVAVALPLLALIAAPVIAVNVQRHGPPPASAQANLLASEVERLWRQTTPLPLRFVGGNAELADGVASYAVDRPRVLTGMPQPSVAMLARYRQSNRLLRRGYALPRPCAGHGAARRKRHCAQFSRAAGQGPALHDFHRAAGT